MKLETRTIKKTNVWLTYDAPRWLRVVEHFLRVRVFRQTGYLIDKWTIVDEEMSEPLYGLGDEE